MGGFLCVVWAKDWEKTWNRDPDGTYSMYGGFLCAEVFEEQKNDSSGNEVSIPPRKRLRIYGIAQEEHEKHEKRPDPRNDFKNLFSCFFTHFVSECVFRFPLFLFSMFLRLFCVFRSLNWEVYWYTVSG